MENFIMCWTLVFPYHIRLEYTPRTELKPLPPTIYFDWSAGVIKQARSLAPLQCSHGPHFSSMGLPNSVNGCPH